MEPDLHKNGFIIYDDFHSVKTSNGVTSQTIAGNSSVSGYLEGVGSHARFHDVRGFTQLSDTHIVVADYSNECLRIIDSSLGTTSAFSGQCQLAGYEDGFPGQFNHPSFVAIDKMDVKQLLVVDQNNKALRAVKIDTGAVTTFVRSSLLKSSTDSLAQDSSGDVFVSSAYAIYRIAYSEGTIRLLARSAGVRGDQDGTLTTSLFSLTTYLKAIGTDVLLIADMRNHKLKLLDIKSDRVSTVNVCTNCLQSPTSVLVAQDSLYIGQKRNILKFKCEPIYSFFVHGTNYFTSL